MRTSIVFALFASFVLFACATKSEPVRHDANANISMPDAGATDAAVAAYVRELENSFGMEPSMLSAAEITDKRLDVFASKLSEGNYSADQLRRIESAAIKTMGLAEVGSASVEKSASLKVPVKEMSPVNVNSDEQIVTKRATLSLSAGESFKEPSAQKKQVVLPPAASTIPAASLKPAVALPSAKGDWFVQLSAESTLQAAEGRKLKAAKHDVSIDIQEAVVKGRTYFRVLAGPYASKAGAESAKSKIAALKIGHGAPFVREAE